MKKRIQLVGQPTQRNTDSLQALIEGKDQRYKNGFVIPIQNSLTGAVKHYFEKRPGLEQANIGDCLGEISAGCRATAIFYSRATGKYITAFCEDDIYVNCDSVGTTDPTTDLVCVPFLQVEYDSNGSHAEVSSNNMTPTVGGTPAPEVTEGYIKFRWSNSGLGQSATVTYSDSGTNYINEHNASDYTIEFYVNVGAGGSGSSDQRLIWVTGTSCDSRVFVVRNTGDANYLKIYYRDGNFNTYGSVYGTALTVDTWTHVAVCVSPSAADKIVSIYYDGVRVANSTGLDFSPLPTANGEVVLGSGQAGAVTQPVLMDDIRISPCFIYTGTSFTPPARGSLVNP